MKKSLVFSLFLLPLLLGACGPSSDSVEALQAVIGECEVGSHASISTTLGASNSLTAKCEWVVTKETKESWSKKK